MKFDITKPADRARVAAEVRKIMPTVDEMLAFQEHHWVRVAQFLAIAPELRRDWRERASRLRALRLAGDSRADALKAAEDRLQTILAALHHHRGQLDEARVEIEARLWVQSLATPPAATVAEDRPAE